MIKPNDNLEKKKKKNWKDCRYYMGHLGDVAIIIVIMAPTDEAYNPY